MNYSEFQTFVLQKGAELYREMPWRQDTRPYYILVSELMLQQTQVPRVLPKFRTFTERFSTEDSLAKAQLSDVLVLWNGLGYNRRAKYLHMAADMIMRNFGGEFPRNYNDILKLPGVGQSTAGAITAYAFNEPAVFIETNIRTVYFHHFFPNAHSVSDKEVASLLEVTIPKDRPREFYWALMDYGTHLKRQKVARNQMSTHYKKQTPLKGSLREMRGTILRALLKGPVLYDDLALSLQKDTRFGGALAGLKRDGLIQEYKGVVHLTNTAN